MLPIVRKSLELLLIWLCLLTAGAIIFSPHARAQVNCTDSSGKGLTYTSATHAWKCGTSVRSVTLGGTGAATLTGLTLGNGTSAFTAYAGTSCTNQFPRSLNSSGVATCTSVATTDISGAITPDKGGTGIVNNAASTWTVSGNFATTITISGITALTFPTSGTVSTLAGTEILTNKRINPRVDAVADATSITPVGDSDDLVTQANTQGVGTLTVNAPTGTPVNGQKIIIRLKSSSVQTFSFNAIYRAGTDVTMPTVSTGASKTDYMGFIYNSADTKWDLIAKSFGY